MISESDQEEAEFQASLLLDLPNSLIEHAQPAETQVAQPEPGIKLPHIRSRRRYTPGARFFGCPAVVHWTAF
jgi:hypothetical protein